MKSKRPVRTDRVCAQVRVSADSGVRCSLQVRFHQGAAVALGPCKADLLDALGTTGSLRRAARQVGTSYMRAWLMVKDVNASFRQPLVTLQRGGREGGGGRLTAAGRKVLALYRKTEQDCVRAAAPAVRALDALLRD